MQSIIGIMLHTSRTSRAPIGRTMRLKIRDIAVSATIALVAVLALLCVSPAGARTQPARTTQPGSVHWAFYVTYNTNSLLSLQANVSLLNHVSPYFYNLDNTGRVAGTDQASVTSLLHERGVLNLPMLKNTPQYNDFTAIITDTARQTSIISQLDNLVTTYNYSGITIDFEGLNAGDKANLTAFMTRLYTRFHAEGKLVAIAVAPKVIDNAVGWAAPYDYAALSNVADYVLVMAYDYHYPGGDPGPVAPLPRLEVTADYTVSRIPLSKLVWGVGVYGYDWKVGPDGKSLAHADARTYSEASAIASQPGADFGYDENAQAPYVNYTSNGQPRQLWYEDARSFQAKLDLIAQYGMAGFGIWRLGQEDPQIWDVLSGKIVVPTPPSTTVTPTPVRTSTLAPTSTPVRTSTPTVTATSTPTPSPTPKPPPPAACNDIQPFASTAAKLYFPPTHHSLSGTFLQYWQTNGGLAVFGYPLTEPSNEKSRTDGKTYLVQYFERNRFEYHPENQPPNNVLLGLLGVQATANRTFPGPADLVPGPDTLYFPQVDHALSSIFLDYWQANGSLAQLGYPISEPLLEQSHLDGKTYTVQYTERARLEYHPENPTQYQVLLGLLGLNVSPCI